MPPMFVKPKKEINNYCLKENRREFSKVSSELEKTVAFYKVKKSERNYIPNPKY